MSCISLDQLWLKRESAYNTSTWSGGETTEIFIYPESSRYTLRQFSFRISSATVTQSESTFSNLNGFYRYLMPLSGSIELMYNGQSKKKVGPFELADFDGDLSTKSFGECCDFNLMINKKQGWIGQINTITKDSILHEDKLFTGFFALEDRIKLENLVEGLSIDLNKGDFLMIKSRSDFDISITCRQPKFQLIKVTVGK